MVICKDESPYGQEEIAEYGFVDPSTKNVLPDFLTTAKFDPETLLTPQIFDYL